MGLVLHARANGQLEVLTDSNGRISISTQQAYLYPSFGLLFPCFACSISTHQPFCDHCMAKEWHEVPEPEPEHAMVSVRFRHPGQEAKHLMGKIFAAEHDQVMVVFEDGDILQLAKSRLAFIATDELPKSCEPNNMTNNM